MNLLIPVHAENGLHSRISPHFGSAPVYLVVDIDSGAVRAVPNRNQHHSHGGCAPLALLDDVRFDAMVVGGIGAGALGKLNAANVEVFFAEHGTVGETLDALKAGNLNRMQALQACSGHSHGGHCHDDGHGSDGNG